jgi:small-conductance mechanosensitive channel
VRTITRSKEKPLPTFGVPPSLTAGIAAHIVAAVLIALLAIAFGQRLRRAVTDLLRRRSKVNPAAALLIGRLVYFAVLVIAALWILNLWGSGITPLLTLLGVVGLTVSLALQDVLRNLFAGFYMLIERPFMLGDIIEVSGVHGTVESIELRLTVLTTGDGLRVTVPNATVFTAVVTNRSAHPVRRWTVYVTLPPAITDLAAVQTAVERASDQSTASAVPPTLAVQSASNKGTLVEVGLWAADAVALGQAIFSLRQSLPLALISVPGAPALPDKLPGPAPAPRRITRHRPIKPNAFKTGSV